MSDALRQAHEKTQSGGWIEQCLDDAEAAQKQSHAEMCVRFHDSLRDVLKNVIEALPQKRDWLDPVLEARTRSLLSEIEKGGK